MSPSLRLPPHSCNNISLNLLKGIGLRNAGNVMNTMRQDPLLRKGNPAGNEVIINP